MDYTKIPSDEIIKQTIVTLKSHGVSSTLVNNKQEALTEIINTIPAGSRILNGSSTSLIDVGFMDILKGGKHQWINLHAEILRESDPIKRFDLRRKALTEADYFLSSVNAITEDGKLVAVDASGSRVGAMPSAAKKLLLVVGANKIVPNLNSAFERIRNYVFPLEDKRMMKLYNIHTSFGKWVIIENESTPKRIQLILVKEALGF